MISLAQVVETVRIALREWACFQFEAKGTGWEGSKAHQYACIPFLLLLFLNDYYCFYTMTTLFMHICSCSRLVYSLRSTTCTVRTPIWRSMWFGWTLLCKVELALFGYFSMCIHFSYDIKHTISVRWN
jgi:hypothetical protein